MITMQGIYDGVKIIPTQKIPSMNISKVEITFLEDISISREEEMQNFITQTNFDFWGNERDEYEGNNINEK